MSADYPLVFLHGAGLSSYIWEGFSQQYFPGSICAPFPLRESNKAFKRKIALEDYCQSIAGTILKHSTDREVVLICHSISAIVGLQLTKSLPGKIKGIIGVGASVPHSGRNFFSTLPAPQRILMPWITRFTGTKPPANIIRNSLCAGLDASTADKIVRAYSDESYHLYASKIQYDLAGIYRGYVKLLSDNAYPLRSQELSIDNFDPNSLKELKSGHLPMLSQPTTLASKLKSMLTDINQRTKVNTK